MTDMERVWARIKKTADELAARNQFVSPATAKNIVADIFRTQHADRPTVEALEFLSSELIALLNEKRQKVG